eukprot:TRINITY_DN35750_c1_g1_i1.p2 TRINITY_DN35750_c1_g1~~TRINITY_DN35750_c1_g1_i1.p2  ORF type:complete len:130 (-),score=19.89 TRINITY_DN35750_c1_g1_i1:8-397(-)
MLCSGAVYWSALQQRDTTTKNNERQDRKRQSSTEQHSNTEDKTRQGKKTRREKTESNKDRQQQGTPEPEIDALPYKNLSEGSGCGSAKSCSLPQTLKINMNKVNVRRAAAASIHLCTYVPISHEGHLQG